VLALLGSRDENLKVAEELLAADIHVRGNEVTLSGAPSDVAFAERVFAELVTLATRGQQLGPDAVRRTVAMLSAGGTESPAEVLSLDIISRRGRTIRPKTLNQKRYVDAIDQHTVVFCIGPAGTGKTYLAMAKAVQALQAKQVNRIILTRPAVEAGERLGFLPGTLYEKIDPYLRPLYDALHDMVDPESIPRLMQAGTIEVAPLAYMRGRTLNDAFIILDEAQNTSPEQMKMFLTRLGFGSKIVVTGDVTQVDLPGGTQSGLRVVQNILGDVDDVHFATLSSSDVVRHKLVGDIVDAYDRWSAIQDDNQDARRSGPRGQARRGRMKVSRLAELSVLLVGLDEMADLHERYMDLPGPTDVMAFPMDELESARRPDAPDPGPTLLGDLVLCPRFARDQARKAGHSLMDELHLLTVHGVLHLLGYDHAEPAEEREMFTLQKRILADFKSERAAAQRRAAQRREDDKLLGAAGFVETDDSKPDSDDTAG
jgi:phosphate starvation-inducible PhoH-like protein